MLVSIQTQFVPVRFVSSAHMPSAEAVRGATSLISPPIMKLLEPAVVSNAQAFGAPSIGALQPAQLMPSGIVNTSVISPKTIQSLAPPVVTSYANQNGTGDRRATIVATASSGLFASGSIQNMIDGAFAAAAYFNVAGGQWMKFDFGTPRLFDAFRWYQSNAQNHGDWKWQASNDDVSYVDVGASFLLEGVTGGAAWEIAQPAGNTTKHRYWMMQQISGGTSSGPYTYEIEFKID